jgi:hypothetical protein
MRHGGVRAVVVLVVLVVLALGLSACSGGDDEEERATPTTGEQSPPSSAPEQQRPAKGLDLELGNVLVESVGPPAPVPRAVTRDVVARAEQYVREATLRPLRTGRRADGLARLFTSEVSRDVARGGRDRSSLTDEALPRAVGDVTTTAEPVAVTVLEDGEGQVIQVAATLDYTTTAELRRGPVTIHRVGDLYFERGPDGGWRIASYDVGVQRTDRRGRAEPSDAGYWLVSSEGAVFARGSARFRGSATALSVTSPIADIAATSSGNGYWLVGADGGVFAFGDAHFAGPRRALRPSAPIVGIAATPSGRGYWLVGADGGVFAFGDARYRGRPRRLSALIVDVAATPSGKGYWIVGTDGRVLAFGDAKVRRPQRGARVGAPIVGMAVTPEGSGYWLVGADSRIYAFGDAKHVSRRARPNAGVVGIAPTPSGEGWWMPLAGGGVLAAGDARQLGPAGYRAPNDPITGIARVP